MGVVHKILKVAWAFVSQALCVMVYAVGLGSHPYVYASQSISQVDSPPIPVFLGRRYSLREPDPLSALRSIRVVGSPHVL